MLSIINLHEHSDRILFRFQRDTLIAAFHPDSTHSFRQQQSCQPAGFFLDSSKQERRHLTIAKQPVEEVVNTSFKARTFAVEYQRVTVATGLAVLRPVNVFRGLHSNDSGPSPITARLRLFSLSFSASSLDLVKIHSSAKR